MKEFSLKINHRLSGIKESSVSLKQDYEDERFLDTDPEEGSSVADAIRIRQLNGRIKILEMELQKAREESFRVGFEEGQSSSFQEANKKVDAMRIELQAIEIKYLETIEQIENPLLDLSKRMAQEVLGMELKHRTDYDEILKERLRKMLYEVVDQHKLIIEVNPSHLKQMADTNLNEALNTPAQMELNVVGNRGLKPGEAKIRTEDYSIDGTYKEQLSHLNEQFKNRMI